MTLSEMVDAYTLAGKRGKEGMDADALKRVESQMGETVAMLDRSMAYFVEEKDYAVDRLYNRKLEDTVYFCANLPHILQRRNAK
jgi:hypothetical protein